MEEKARKYCLLYKTKPAYAITCMYKELSQSLINGIGVLLTEWLLYVAQCDDAFMDLMIPLDFQQLCDFITELLPSDSSDAINIARTIRRLKDQNASVKTLNNLRQSLQRCMQSVDVIVLLSVINARIGRDKECLRYLNALSKAKEFNSVKSRLHLVSIADLQLLKLTIESAESTDSIGLPNNAYSRDDGNESSESEIDQSIEMDYVTSATKGLNFSNEVDTDERATKRVYDEILCAISHLAEPGEFLGEVMMLHMNADRSYIAGYLALMYFTEHDKLPEIPTDIAKELNQSILKLVQDITDTCKKDNELQNWLLELQEVLLERALMYCRVARCLDADDEHTNIILLTYLYKNIRILEALDFGEKLITLGHENNEVSRVICYCRIFEGNYERALDVINTAIDEDSDCTGLISVRGFTLFLVGNVKAGISDVLRACGSDISTTVHSFKSLKQSDQVTIKKSLSDSISENITRWTTEESNTDKCPQSSNQNHIIVDTQTTGQQRPDCTGMDLSSKCDIKLDDMKILCDFLTILYKNDLELHLLQVEVLLHSKQFGDAQKSLVLLIKRVPDDPLPMIHLANVRMRLGAYVAAAEDFRAIFNAIGYEKLAGYILQLSGDDRDEIARVLRRHGFHHLQHHCYSEAIECFNIAIIALGDAATGLILVRAFSFANLGDYELAVNDFDTVLDREDDNVAARIGSSVMYSMLGYEEESLENVSWILDEYRDTAVKVLQKLPLDCVRTFTSVVENYVSEQFNGLVSNNDTEKDDIANSTHGFIDFLKVLYNKNTNCSVLQAQYFLISGEYDAASEVVDAALLSSPDDISLLTMKSITLAKLSRNSDALELLRGIHRDNREHIESNLKQLTSAERSDLVENATVKGDNLCDLGHYEEAKEYYDLAILVAEDTNIEVLRCRYSCLINLDLLQDALGDISAVIESRPCYKDYCVRAKLLHGLGREKVACSDYIAALDLNEEDAIAYLVEEAMLKHVLSMFCTAASSAFIREQFHEVLKFCEHGLKLDPNHKGLKQLRYRTKCVMNKCVIQ